MPAPNEVQRLLESARDSIGLRHSVRLRMTDKTSSPVVFGFLRPVILLPASLLGRLSETQLRSVLLHELIHLRRGDVWVNCVQTLLQMFYWWHPLLWLANARIRQVREDAVDDAVMSALREEADAYPQTLLEVAKHALGRPLSSLALVGILETRHALRRRIERLVDLAGQPKRGLTLASVSALLAFSALALPMGQAPLKPAEGTPPANSGPVEWPDPRFSGYAEVSLSARFLIVEPATLELFLPALAGAQAPLVVASNEVSEIERKLNRADAQSFPRNQSLTLFSGGRFHYRVGGVPGNVVNYQSQTRSNGSSVVVGAECSSHVAGRPDWVPLDFTLVPWTYNDSTLCQVRLGTADDPETARETHVTIPAGGAMLWIVPTPLRTGKSELVLLKEEKSPREAQNASVLPESDATAQNETVGKLVQDARLLFELGKLDEAEAPLRKALAIDSRSSAAHYYLDLILKARGKPSSSVRFISVHTNQAAGPTTQQNDTRALGFDWYLGNFLMSQGSIGLQGGTAPTLHTNQVSVPTTPQTVLAELSRIRLKQIAFDHQPLAEVVNMLNNEASPVVTFRMSPAESESSGEATKKEIGKVPITILPALTDIRLLDVLEVIVKVASERIRYSIESNEVVFSSRGSERKLYTRVMKVDPIAFVAALSRASGNADLSPEATLTALREFLLKQGVTLQTPETLFFNDREGQLLIHTTLEKLDLIERTVAELSNPPAQLNVKTRFLRLPDSLMRDLWTAIGVTRTDATNFSKILTPAQTSVLLRAISAKDHHNLINEASVTTLSGRQAEVQCVELKTILSNNVPTQIPLGPTIDMTPILGHDGWKIGLRIVTTLRELTGYDEPPDRATLEDPANLSKASGPLPHIRLRQLSAHSTVPDGYSLILVNPLDAKDELAGKPGDLDSHYVVLITPTVIDSAGNRVHTDTEIESLSK